MTRFRSAAAPAAAALVLALVLLAALAPGLLAPGDPLAVDPSRAFRGPGSGGLLGADESGRDLYTRLVWGAGPSVLIGLAATAVGLGLGLVLGLAAGLAGRRIDYVLGRIFELSFAFPSLLLALLVIVILGPGPLPALIAVGLSSAPGYARIIRGRVRTVRATGYVEQARVLGHRPSQILRRHIVPNTAAPLLALATLGIGQSIMWVAALSFLGLGTPPPAPEWGAMLAAGRTYIATAPWLTLVPGTAITLITIATTVLGRALERRKDLP